VLIRPLGPTDEVEALAAHAELGREDFDFLLDSAPAGQSWAAYVDRLEEIRHGVDLAPGRVPATFLVGEVDGRIVGRVSIRHELTDRLARIGGHIGYGVRPAFRRRGYATELLRAGLDVARSVGIARALVTCDDGNLGSATVIERCGGEFESLVADGDEPVKRRYWIDLPS
jgi:predicted acetyltransferase